MSATKLCVRCKRRIEAAAISCVCGWTESQSTNRQHIDCCMDGCQRGALVRVFTKTGWANVCETHYPEVDVEPRVNRNPTCEAIREAYRKSAKFGQINNVPLPRRKAA